MTEQGRGQLVPGVIATVVSIVLILGVWLFLRSKRAPEPQTFQPGECFIMTDGPARGSGDDGGLQMPVLAHAVEDRYPIIDCADWAAQDEPWLVYRVDWVTDADGDSDTARRLEESCPDITLTYALKTVTCLANVEFENG